MPQQKKKNVLIKLNSSAQKGDGVSLKKKRGIKERVGQIFVHELKLYP